MFIPAGLVAQKVKGDIQTKKTETSKSGLDDSTAALKAARKDRKKKRT